MTALANLMGMDRTTLTAALKGLERRGFTARDFHVFHPGGKLGRHLMKVVELMRVGEANPK